LIGRLEREGDGKKRQQGTSCHDKRRQRQDDDGLEGTSGAGELEFGMEMEMETEMEMEGFSPTEAEESGIARPESTNAGGPTTTTRRCRTPVWSLSAVELVQCTSFPPDDPHLSSSEEKAKIIN
jgi:hypothetical protein